MAAATEAMIAPNNLIARVLAIAVARRAALIGGAGARPQKEHLLRTSNHQLLTGNLRSIHEGPNNGPQNGSLVLHFTSSYV